MKIAIRFKDNDFFRTWEGVLRVFLEKYRFTGELNFTKEQIFKICNEISLGIHMVQQNTHGEQNDKYQKMYLVNTKKYLKLTIDRIYVNEEVDEIINRNSKNSFLDSNFHILDTDLDYENNYPIYTI